LNLKINEGRQNQAECIALASRVLVIGLDGVTWDVLSPLMESDRMPRLREVVERGASGVLRSTTPPITPAAWTTFMTGKQPGAHGIIDFERYDPLTNRLKFNSTRCLEHVRNIWQIAGDAGLRVGAVNIPMTYPPIPVHGFMVSGFETPGPHSDFVYPAELKREILSRWPDPTLRAKWRRQPLGGDGLFRQNINYVCRSFHQGAEMTKHLADRFGWDLLMAVFKLTDNLQHKTWKYIDPRWANRHPRRRDMVYEAFGECDKAVGILLDYAAQHDATVMMVSDHGHGSLEGRVQPNWLLKRWGYLHLHGGGGRGVTRGRHWWDRLRGKTKKFAREGNILHDLAVDFSRTRACVMHAGMAGFLYLNLKGRQPCGIVEPSDYERLRDEIGERLLSVRSEPRRLPTSAGDETSQSGVSLFPEVHKPEELYRCSRQDQPWLPDLMLIPQESLAVARKIRAPRPVQWLPYRKIEGTHRPNGILASFGPGIAHRTGTRAHIVDCAPTILAMLGLPVPEDMQGRVLTELFDRPVKVKSASASVTSTRSDETGDVYSEAELEKVTERLSDLGYLE